MANENIPLAETKLKRFVSEEANEVAQAQGGTMEKCIWTMADNSGTKKHKAEEKFEPKSKVLVCNDGDDVPVMETTLKIFARGKQRRESNAVFDQGKIQSEPSPSNTTLGLKQEEANGNASYRVILITI
eukprot:14642623-Ditylum_brightwellii.AAC.1